MCAKIFGKENTKDKNICKVNKANICRVLKIITHLSWEYIGGIREYFQLGFKIELLESLCA